ncbi:MAG: 4Fe-4S dicluster domain-containing protein [Verrucomicrobia bacterium]|nr:4Fe-4S dicluster domain-containing protein [Verrucomicrobiota bacterium]
MRARIIQRESVLEIIDILRREGYDVAAPFRGRGRDTFFDLVTDANKDDVRVHLPNPYYPPKRFVLPHIERMMNIKCDDGGCCVQPETDVTPLAVFGIRSCDVAGIQHLDRFYLDRDFKDVYYERRRDNLFLVNVVCTDIENDIDEMCFCMCADTGPAARGHFDLQLMDLGEVFMVVAGSAKGEKLFEHRIFEKADAAHVEKRREILAGVRRAFKKKVSWFSAAVRLVSRGGVSEQTWEEIGNRCLECGGCTYVCPACTCFTVSDRCSAAGEVERVRIWDSCALSGYTRMAGGFNPRKAVHDRRNRRFFRKLAHYFVQRELSVACVGCGRCENVCHGNIGMPSVVEILRRSSAGM